MHGREIRGFYRQQRDKNNIYNRKPVLIHDVSGRISNTQRILIYYRLAAANDGVGVLANRKKTGPPMIVIILEWKASIAKPISHNAI
jgi:hypothetical protein